MGEDSCLSTPAQADKQKPFSDGSSLRSGDLSFPNSSTMSTCSEMGSETNSYVDQDVDQDYQYGPGIVSKLRTKFLTISLKQNRGSCVSMRRSCSLENILDQKTTVKSSHGVSESGSAVPNGTDAPWSNLKRAKSMDTLLMTLEKEQTSTPCSVVETEVDSPKVREPKVIRRKDGPLTRSTVTIADEEFPKPDTVKTYKRMFEPAESKKTNPNSNVRRRPPVLRATAKSGSNSNLKSNPTNTKPNGVLPPKSIPAAKSNLSAKDIVLKVAPVENGNRIEPPEKESPSNEVETLNKKNQQRSDDLILSGTVRAEAIQLRVKDEVAKRNLRAPKAPNKPSIPLRKPLKTMPPRLVIAQTVEHKTNRTAKEQTAVEKPAIKANVNKRPPKAEINKLERLEATECKKGLENGISNGVKPEVESKPILNGIKKSDTSEDVKKPCQKESVDTSDVKSVKRVTNTPGGNNSMVFDFRGKDVVSHLSVSPAPFGCKAVVRRRNVLIDGKEIMPYLNGFANGGEGDSDDDDDFVDYSVPQPCGLVFEGENVKVGKGSILSTRNKDLKIHFDENVEQSTFVYPSESSLLTDDSSLSSETSSDMSSLDSTTTDSSKPSADTSTKLPSNTALNSSEEHLEITVRMRTFRQSANVERSFVAFKRVLKPPRDRARHFPRPRSEP